MFHAFSFSRACRRAVSVLAVSLLLGSCASVAADEIVIDNAPDSGDMLIPDTEAPADMSGGSLIEDSGSSDAVVGLTIDELQTETSPEEELVDEIELIPADTQRISAHLKALLTYANPTGSDEELITASYIGEQMKALGFTVQQQPFHEGFVNVNGIDAPGVNVIAERGANSEENRTRDIFLVVTHYDSITLPEEDASTDSAKIPYANDKSGAAVLLETARILSQVETDTDICFLFLSGQEDGGYGAKAFIDSLSEANRSRITGVLAVDRVGYDTGMPNVIKTWTGDANDIAALVQESGIWQEAGLILDGVRPLPEDLSSTEDPLSGEETALADDTALAGDTALSGDTALADGAEPEDGIAPETEADDSAETKIPAVWSCLMDPYVVSPNADPVSNPDLNSIQSIFADAGFPSAQVTQYDPERDLELYQQTIDLDLADLTASDLADTVLERLNEGIYNTSETFNDVEILGLEDSILSQDTSLAGDTVPGTEAAEQADTETETETETEIRLPETDPVLLAQNADVLAEVLAYIMDAE